MSLGLVLDALPARGARPGPSRPAILIDDPAMRPAEYPDLPGLARHLHKLRLAGGKVRGLQLQATTLVHNGSSSFPGFKVYLTDEALEGFGEGREFICAIAVQGRPLEAVMAAIAEANPHLPREAQARRRAA